MGWIALVGEQGENTRWQISEAGLVAGRSPSADVVLKHATLSRRHARFYCKGDFDYIRDLRSTNGIRINGRVIDGLAKLEPEDQIFLGDVELVYFQASQESTLDFPGAKGAKLQSSARTSSAAISVKTLSIKAFSDTSRWHQVKLIGQGGMGEVYYAYDRDLAMEVAIKRIRPRADTQRELLLHLHQREASIAKTIRHANVVQVLEDGIFDGDHYMILEWVEGATLDTYARDPGVGLVDRLECLRQVALGLAAAHESGVVHADLKPANVLVVEDIARKLGGENLDILESPEPSPEDLEQQSISDEIQCRSGQPAIPSSLAMPPFVARESEMALLEQVASEVLQLEGSGYRWLLVYGERGVGKRRLCDEFELRNQDQPESVHLQICDDLQIPPANFSGLWISLLPPQLPDDRAFMKAYEVVSRKQQIRELFLHPLLRGQCIRLIERIVKHAPSARLFVDTVESEVGGVPARLVERLKQSFAAEQWTAMANHYCCRLDKIRPDASAVAKRQLEMLQREEKGLQDLFHCLAPLGSTLNFASMLAASGLVQSSLFYLLEHAVAAGYLVKSPKGFYSPVAPLFWSALASRSGGAQLQRTIRSALPELTRQLAQEFVPVTLFFQVAELLMTQKKLDRAFQYYLQGALRARSEYQSRLFVDCIDQARSAYRQAEGKKSVRKNMVSFLNQMVSGGQGLLALDRMRKLPTAVRARLTDFGIAQKIVTDDSAASSAAGENALAPWGTPRYMSPEQARREVLSPASDIFSLGLLVHELVEGQHLLGGLRGMKAIKALLKGPLALPEGGRLPKELRTLVGRMIAADPEARPTAKEVAEEIQNFQIKITFSA